MTTFGLSAFLKLVSSTPRVQRSLIVKRLRGPRSSGYDFHRAMRGICGSYIAGASFEDSLLAVQGITQEHERKSAELALNQLAKWRREYDEPTFEVPHRTFESPSGAFKVRFDSDFGITVDGARIAVHLWNTKRPSLDVRLTRAVLSLFPSLYADFDIADFGVLSLQNRQLIRLGEDARAAIIGRRLIEVLEDTFDELRRGGPRPGAEERPRP